MARTRGGGKGGGPSKRKAKKEALTPEFIVKKKKKSKKKQDLKELKDILQGLNQATLKLAKNFQTPSSDSNTSSSSDSDSNSSSSSSVSKEKSPIKENSPFDISTLLSPERTVVLNSPDREPSVDSPSSKGLSIDNQEDFNMTDDSGRNLIIDPDQEKPKRTVILNPPDREPSDDRYDSGRNLIIDPEPEKPKPPYKIPKQHNNNDLFEKTYKQIEEKVASLKEKPNLKLVLKMANTGLNRTGLKPCVLYNSEQGCRRGTYQSLSMYYCNRSSKSASSSRQSDRFYHMCLLCAKSLGSEQKHKSKDCELWKL